MAFRCLSPDQPGKWVFLLPDGLYCYCEAREPPLLDLFNWEFLFIHVLHFLPTSWFLSFVITPGESQSSHSDLHLVIWFPILPWAYFCLSAFALDSPSAWNVFSQLSAWLVHFLHFLQIPRQFIFHWTFYLNSLPNPNVSWAPLLLIVYI